MTTHPSHNTTVGLVGLAAPSYSELCILCGATDGDDGKLLAEPCPEAAAAVADDPPEAKERDPLAEQLRQLADAVDRIECNDERRAWDAFAAAALSALLASRPETCPVFAAADVADELIKERRARFSKDKETPCRDSI